MNHTGKVGNLMKRTIRSTQSAARRAMSALFSLNNAVRFYLAQLFFGIFGFWFTPIPI